MSKKSYEEALQRLCSERECALRFLADPRAVLAEFDLTEIEKELLFAIDREGLQRKVEENMLPSPDEKRRPSKR